MTDLLTITPNDSQPTESKGLTDIEMRPEEILRVVIDRMGVSRDRAARQLKIGPWILRELLNGEERDDYPQFCYDMDVSMLEDWEYTSTLRLRAQLTWSGVAAICGISKQRIMTRQRGPSKSAPWPGDPLETAAILLAYIIHESERSDDTGL